MLDTGTCALQGMRQYDLKGMRNLKVTRDKIRGFMRLCSGEKHDDDGDVDNVENCVYCRYLHSLSLRVMRDLPRPAG